MKLIETLVILSLLSMLAITGISSYIHYYQKKEFDTAVAQFIQAVDFAKKMSIAGDETVYLCASTNQMECNTSWRGPVFAFTSDDPTQIQNILQKFYALPTDVTLEIQDLKEPALYFMPDRESANNSTLIFKMNGHVHQFTLSKTGVLNDSDSQ